jgi:hypothetical protein
MSKPTATVLVLLNLALLALVIFAPERVPLIVPMLPFLLRKEGSDTALSLPKEEPKTTTAPVVKRVRKKK